MSHFIQDNCAVVQTIDDKHMLFIKGGDNNLRNGTTNRRCTSWHLQGVFENKQKFDDYIELLVTTDMSGGSWVLKSLKDTHGYGEFVTEQLIFNRFEKAYGSRMQSEWKLSSVEESNIYAFEKHLVSLFKSKSISLSNENGIDKTDLGFIWSYEKDVTPEQNGIKRLSIKTVPPSQGYRELILEYAHKSKYELLSNFNFMMKYAAIKKTYNGIMEFLINSNYCEEVQSFNFSIFAKIFEYEHNIKELLSSSCVHIIKYFPSCMETIIRIDSFKNKIDEIITSEEHKYSSENMKTYKEQIFNADYKQMKENFDLALIKNRNTSKEAFIEDFNNIVKYCFYKQSNVMLPELISSLKKSLKYINKQFTFKEYMFTESKFQKNESYISFQNFNELPLKYKHQYKKNQNAVKDMARFIVENFSEYFIQEGKGHIIESYIDFFNFNKTVKIIEPEKKIANSPLYTNEQTNMFAEGRLF